jgi:hypothetical protein
MNTLLLIKNLLLMLIWGTISAFAQAPDTLWTKIYGGTDYDRGNSMVKTSDGGFAIVGETGGYFNAGLFTNGDVWLVKMDQMGDTLWTKTYGGPGIDEGNSIQQTSDNGYILAGAKSNNLQIYDAWLIRTDENGDTIWTKTYGENFGEENILSVRQTSDNGFIFTGFASTQTTFSRDVWLVRTNENGDTLWTKTFGGTGPDLGNSVLQTSDNGFIVTGSTRVIGNNSDLFLIRTDENGDTLWTKIYNGQPSFNTVDEGRDIIELSDNGFIILGFSNANVWLLRTDENGDTLWTKHIPGGGNSIRQISDGGFIFAGGGWLIRTDANGDTLWTKTLDGLPNSVEQTSDGGFLASGYTFLNNTLEDLWIVLLDSEGTTAINDGQSIHPDQFMLLQNYPNPFNPTTKIIWRSAASGWQTLKIYDVLGNKIKTLVDEYKTAGTYEVEFDAGILPSGIYFYRLQSGKYSDTKKLILLR